MGWRKNSLAAVIACAAPFCAKADTARNFFVEANILSVFYHELGHAVIDLMDVPIFGQEEDAADVMAVLLIDWVFDEQVAQDIAYASAFGYINDPEQMQETVWWGLHGPDEQRFYNHVCLFFGANPEDRAELAYDLGLPEERAETCPEEYELAAASWGGVFDEMDATRSGGVMHFVPGDGLGSDVANRVLGAEIIDIAQEITLPEDVTVRVETCGEANAFYDPQDRSITFCSEFVSHLQYLFARNFE